MQHESQVKKINNKNFIRQRMELRITPTETNVTW